MHWSTNRKILAQEFPPFQVFPHQGSQRTRPDGQNSKKTCEERRLRSFARILNERKATFVLGGAQISDKQKRGCPSVQEQMSIRLLKSRTDILFAVRCHIYSTSTLHVYYNIHYPITKS